MSLMDHILQHDTIIFASPVYWYAMSAQMKVFVDRLSDFLCFDQLYAKGKQLSGKQAYVVATSVNAEIDHSFLTSFINTFQYLGMVYGGFVHADCKNGLDLKKLQGDIDIFLNAIQSPNS